MIALYAMLFLAANALVYIYFNLNQPYGRYLRALILLISLSLMLHLLPIDYLLTFGQYLGLLCYSAGLALFELAKERLIEQFYSRFTPQHPSSPKMNDFIVGVFRFFLKVMYVIIYLFQMHSVSNPSFLD